MSAVRLRRLQSDFLRLGEFINRHPRLQLIRADGAPPENYQIEYRVTSLRQKDGQLFEVGTHLVEIALPRDYPRTPPLCRMLTPVFHPNIAPHAICIGDHWSAGETLASLVSRIGEMLAYQSYNTKSPLNGEAAKWVDQNLARLPLDKVNMQVEDLPGTGTTVSIPAPPPLPTMAAPGAAPQVIPMVAPPPMPTGFEPPAAVPAQFVTCATCAARLRVRPELGSQFRCPRCKAIVTVGVASA